MSLADINRAAVDPDLIARAEAAAAQLGVGSPTNFVAIQMRAIVTQPTDTDEVHHQRAFTLLAAQNVEIELVLQTRGKEHVQQVLEQLRASGMEADLM